MSDLGQILAQISFLLDQCDEAIFDLKEYGGAWLDVF